MNRIDPLMIAGEQDHPTTIIIHPSHLGSCHRTPRSPMSRREIRRPRPLRRFRHGWCRRRRRRRRGGIQELLRVEALQGSLPTLPTAMEMRWWCEMGEWWEWDICFFVCIYMYKDRYTWYVWTPWNVAIKAGNFPKVSVKWCQLSRRRSSGHFWAFHSQNLLTAITINSWATNPGCLVGILIMVYYHP